MRALIFKFNANTGGADLSPNEKSMGRDDWLRTMIHTSLFTDKRAQGKEIPDGETDPRGCWMDSLHGQSYGSLLWTLKRRKINSDLLKDAHNHAFNACHWLLLKGHVLHLKVIVTRHKAKAIAIRVQARKPDGSDFDEEVIYAL